MLQMSCKRNKKKQTCNKNYHFNKLLRVAFPLVFCNVQQKKFDCYV